MDLVRTASKPERLFDLSLLEKLMLNIVTRASHIIQPEAAGECAREPVYHDIGNDLVVCWMRFRRRPAKDFLSDVDKTSYWRARENTSKRIWGGLLTNLSNCPRYTCHSKLTP